MKVGSGGSGRVGFKACEACGDVFNEILASTKAFGGSRFSWPSTRVDAVVLCTVDSGEAGWTRKKGGKDVVAVVKGGRERRILDPGRDEGGGGRMEVVERG